MSKLFGIDTSRWQGDFDFKGAKDNEGVDFAIIKAGGKLKIANLTNNSFFAV